MKKDLWQRAEELFHNALEHPPEARRAFLDKACGEDAELRRQVETLLSQDEQAGSFLEKPALAGAIAEEFHMIGKTLGHYRISRQIGKGGMGEVFQAKDQVLGRDVAIKVLPGEFVRHADRVSRFQREAKVLASLNHPNIAAIYGLEKSGETNFLVLELVEGETLADQIKAGIIPVEEALKLALLIAEALEAAHEKGVIHRDLKPANIKVTPDGKVKVLDFGLAKSFAGEQSELNLSNSTTLSDMATQQGVILGTAAYMSPEQAKGNAVDKRTDIWAFGCLLFEMLTGQAAFQGEDITEILASVVKGGVSLDLLSANVHPRVREAVTRCLQKDLKRRYSGISDARYEIEQALADPCGVLVQPVMLVEPRTKLRKLLPWFVAVLGITIVGVAVWKLKSLEPRQIIHFYYELPEGQQFSNLNYPVLAISPDGKQFVYSTPKGLYLRSVDDLTAKLIPGTEGSVQQPFFSPDGKSVGYFSVADQQLKTIPIGGGTPISLCAVTQLSGACWNADNTIAYGQNIGDVMRISANGGTPESFVKMTAEFATFPQILPDGRSVLYNASKSTVSIQWSAMVHSLKSGETKELFRGLRARYLPTRNIIVYGSPDHKMYADRFDLDGLKVAGKPIPIVEGVGSPPHYAISDSGTLVYIPQTTSATHESAAAYGRTLVWVDRNGREESLAAPPKPYFFPNISPDKTKVAMTILTGGDFDIWVWDLLRKTLMQISFNGGLAPLWTPDSKRIVFFSQGRMSGGPSGGVCWKAADGTGKEERLGLKFDRWFFPYCWSLDGKNLIGSETQDQQRYGITLLSMDSDHARKPLLQEHSFQTQPKISPDGLWIAYTSDESGNDEIYVRSFPDVNNKRQVSTNGGNNPLWSPDGQELFYLSKDGYAMTVSVSTKPTLSFGTPKILFRNTNQTIRTGPSWDIHPDGKRFLMVKPPAATGAAPAAEGLRKINVIVNWFEELKQRVPQK